MAYLPQAGLYLPPERANAVSAICIILAIALVVTIYLLLFAADELFESQRQLEMERRCNAKLRKKISAHLVAAKNLYTHVEALEARRYVVLRRFWRRSTYRHLSDFRLGKRTP